MSPRPRVDTRTELPFLTMIALLATAATTATRLFGSEVVHALWRDPQELRSGEVWRLLSPVLVQSDRSVLVVLATFALCAAIGVVGERVFTRPLWITLYVIGALVGHGIGEVFQPRQGGTSVAFAAILGGLAACAIRRDVRVPQPVRIEALLAIPLAILDTAFRDIHGLPFLAGLVVTALWYQRVSSGPRLHRIRIQDLAPEQGSSADAGACRDPFSNPNTRHPREVQVSDLIECPL
jgi:hypothetical protein